MIEYFVVAISAFLSSLLSFFSGFGLSTILMPVIAIFFPLPIAIGLSAIVHLIHNLLKAALLWRAIDWAVVLKFGSAALIFSIPGALLLKKLSLFAPIKEYSFLGISGELSILHISRGALLIIFATLEVFPLKTYRFKNLFIGGMLSGFFGGLLGNQGALRSIFLMNMQLDKRAFIGTNAFIAMIVDSIRVIVYSLSFHTLFARSNMPLLSLTLMSAIAGVFLGAILLHKMTIEWIQKGIIALLYILGILFVFGVI